MSRPEWLYTITTQQCQSQISPHGTHISPRVAHSAYLTFGGVFRSAPGTPNTLFHALPACSTYDGRKTYDAVDTGVSLLLLRSVCMAPRCDTYRICCGICSDIKRTCDDPGFRDVKGTTGTRASFLALFDGDHDKVKQSDEFVKKLSGFEYAYPATGQTYSR